MSNFKLEFKLKQHTPLIHFQHDQSGATLRATELKPKLDKFLIKHVFKNDFQKYKHFLVGYDGKQKKPSDKDAFDYKVKIFPNGLPAITKPNKFLYFAKEHKMVSYESLTLIITSFHNAFLTEINKKLGDFLLITNFGTRSSKGYGSFVLENFRNHELTLKKYFRERG